MHRLCTSILTSRYLDKLLHSYLNAFRSLLKATKQHFLIPKFATNLEISADRSRHDVIHDERSEADIAGDDEPLSVDLLPANPDVNGEGGQVATQRDDHVCQPHQLTKVQDDETTGPWGVRCQSNVRCSHKVSANSLLYYSH